MLYIRDLTANVSITDPEDGEKIEVRQKRVLRDTSMTIQEAKKVFLEGAKKRALNEYGLQNPKITVGAVKEALFERS